VIAPPCAVHAFVEDAVARPDVQGGPVVAATHHHVVDAPPQLQLPVPVLGGHEWVLGGEGVPRLPWMSGPPCIPVADAHAAQGLPPAQEAHARRVRGGVKVPGKHNVHLSSRGELLYGPCRDHRLQLALVLEGELPVGQVVDEQ
jgi:hypothetical protein